MSTIHSGWTHVTGRRCVLKTPGVVVKRMGAVLELGLPLRMACAARRQSVGLGGLMLEVKHFIACWGFSPGLLEGGGGGHEGGGAGALSDGLINNNESHIEK